MPTSEIIGIKGTGVYFPKKKVKVEHLAKHYKLDYSKILDEHGVREIHVSSQGEDEFFMSIKAIQDSLKNANLNPKDINVIIYCKGLTKKKSTLSFSSRIIEYINATNAYGFDLDAGFIGGLLGIHVANDIIKNSYQMKNAVVVAAQEFDEMYLFGDKESRLKNMIFGDGAAAVILSKNCINNKILSSNFVIDHYTKFIDQLLSEKHEMSNVHKIINSLDVLGIVKHLKETQFMADLTRRWVENAHTAIESCLDSVNLDLKDVDHLIKTQLSTKETALLADKLKVSQDRIYNTSIEKGHLGNADILSNLHLTLQNSNLRNLDIIVLVAANYDCSSGAIVLRR